MGYLKKTFLIISLDTTPRRYYFYKNVGCVYVSHYGGEENNHKNFNLYNYWKLQTSGVYKFLNNELIETIFFFEIVLTWEN